jgi:hypothetical protein
VYIRKIYEKRVIKITMAGSGSREAGGKGG